MEAFDGSVQASRVRHVSARFVVEFVDGQTTLDEQAEAVDVVVDDREVSGTIAVAVAHTQVNVVLDEYGKRLERAVLCRIVNGQLVAVVALIEREAHVEQVLDDAGVVVLGGYVAHVHAPLVDGLVVDLIGHQYAQALELAELGRYVRRVSLVHVHFVHVLHVGEQRREHGHVALDHALVDAVAADAVLFGVEVELETLLFYFELISYSFHFDV